MVREDWLLSKSLSQTECVRGLLLAAGADVNAASKESI